MPARLQRLRVRNFRSIEGGLDIQFPDNQPLILIGENNAGKSNIVRALDLLLGQQYPGTHEPDDNEFYGRDRSAKITIRGDFPDTALFGRGYSSVRWHYDSTQQESIFYRGMPGFGGQEYGYINNEDRSSLSCIVIEAERNLTYQLSYSSKYTLLSRLMHRFHKALSDDTETRGELLRLFNEVRSRFNAIQSFVDFTSVLQTRLGEFSENMTHRLEVDFEAYNPINFFHALRLQAVEGSERRALTEMGTGEQQVLALSLAYAYASAFHEGMLLIIEEPEAHLHPLAQQWLARRLHALAESGLQLVITTHSSHFIDLTALSGLALVRKGPTGTLVTQLTTADLVAACIEAGADPDRTREDSILAYYGAVATPEIMEGFLARSIVLVEGRTEALALPVLWRLAGFEHTAHGCAVLPVGGKGNLAKWKRLFEAYGIPCFVVFDNDLDDDRQSKKRKDALLTLGVPAERHEMLLRTTEWIVENNFAVLGNNYEDTMRASFPGYAALEEEAKAQGVDTKPFVARWATDRVTIDGSPGAERLRLMVSMLAQLNPPPGAPEA